MLKAMRLHRARRFIDKSPNRGVDEFLQEALQPGAMDGGNHLGFVLGRAKQPINKGDVGHKFKQRAWAVGIGQRRLKAGLLYRGAALFGSRSAADLPSLLGQGSAKFAPPATASDY